MAILVTGGAGYIGSIVAADLIARGESVVVVDSLVCGYRKAIPSEAIFYEGDMGDKPLIREILLRHKIVACMHFSAFKDVGESVREPLKYYINNTSRTLLLLEALEEAGVDKFIFSSTCATYGEPEYLPIDELHPQLPKSPYGRSKLLVEHALCDISNLKKMKHIIFRYFNACGATPERGLHPSANALMSIVLCETRKKNPEVSIFGNNYPTPDGTAVRDFIHVRDLSRAHILGLDYLRDGGESVALNLGTGRGYSVAEVVNECARITGTQIVIHKKSRRSGDLSNVIANPSLAKKTLGWTATESDLQSMIQSSWDWLQSHPNGYDD